MLGGLQFPLAQHKDICITFRLVPVLLFCRLSYRSLEPKDCTCLRRAVLFTSYRCLFQCRQWPWNYLQDFEIKVAPRAPTGSTQSLMLHLVGHRYLCFAVHSVRSLPASVLQWLTILCPLIQHQIFLVELHVSWTFWTCWTTCLVLRFTLDSWMAFIPACRPDVAFATVDLVAQPQGHTESIWPCCISWKFKSFWSPMTRWFEPGLLWDLIYGC
jgi:hypothetical protein